MKHFLGFLMFLPLLAGCLGDDIDPSASGADYFPIEKGLYHIYAVHEVRYSASADPQVSDYEVMTEVVDSFPSTENDYTFVIHRSTRPGEGQPWEPLDTWTVRTEGDELIVSEGNIPYVKLLFPVDVATRWNGNRFNAMGEDEYHYRNIGESRVVDGMTFENTLTVEQELNEDRIVYFDAREEVYALDAGLVYKEVIQLNYCTEDHCLGQQKIDHGTELRMEIREYGKH